MLQKQDDAKRIILKKNKKQKHMDRIFFFFCTQIN